MSQPSPSDPIDRLLSIHATTRQHLEALTTSSPPPAQALIGWIEGSARVAHDILEQSLFPALIESMAGSDAVCLKGMTGGLARDRAALDRQWRQTVRPALTDSATADGPAACTAWVHDYLDWLSRADEELLPMAARLLDDTAFDELAVACRQLDGLA